MARIRNNRSLQEVSHQCNQERIRSWCNSQHRDKKSIYFGNNVSHFLPSLQSVFSLSRKSFEKERERQLSDYNWSVSYRDSLTDRPTDRSTDRLIDWLNDCLSFWLMNQLTYWLIVSVYLSNTWTNFKVTGDHVLARGNPEHHQAKPVFTSFWLAFVSFSVFFNSRRLILGTLLFKSGKCLSQMSTRSCPYCCSLSILSSTSDTASSIYREVIEDMVSVLNLKAPVSKCKFSSLVSTYLF